MGMKPRPKGLLRKACRYGEGDVALYKMGTNPDKTPHDYDEFIKGSVWRSMGGRVPPWSTMDEGYVAVRILVEEIKPPIGGEGDG